jgi:hypothetical protein
MIAFAEYDVQSEFVLLVITNADSSEIVLMRSMVMNGIGG